MKINKINIEKYDDIPQEVIDYIHLLETENKFDIKEFIQKIYNIRNFDEIIYALLKELSDFANIIEGNIYLFDEKVNIIKNNFVNVTEIFKDKIDVSFSK